MNLYKAFRISSTLMISVGLLSIALAEGSVFYLFLALAGVSLGWLYEKNPVLSHSTGAAAAVLCVGFTPLDYLLVTQDIIVAMGHLLILLQVVKLLSAKKNRDYLQMFLISLVQIAVASVLTIELDFSIPFVLYLVFATWTLILFHLKREYEKSLRLSGETELPEEIKVEKTRGVITSSFFFGSTSICMLTLLLTSIFFVIMPRLSAGLLWHAQIRPMRVSGFNESIDLGQSGEIQLGDKEVMRVQILSQSGPNQSLSYFRGVALSHYDGEKWRKYSPEEIDIFTPEDLAAARKNVMTHAMEIRNGRRVFNIRSFKKDPENTVIQRIWQSPLDTKVLFGLHPIYRVEFFSREAPTAIDVDSQGSLYNQNSQYGFVGYEAYSLNLDSSLPELEKAETYPVVSDIDYTQLPAPGRGFRYEELKNLAEKIIGDAGARTTFEKVKAVEQHLKGNLSYTRNINRTPDVEPVYDFIFNQKAGHCELFASAMAVLLRTVGIPARVANGYCGGQWNPYGEFFLVRQKDAHCWVEVFFDKDTDPYNKNSIGWVRFDPTPPSVLDDGGFFSPVTNFFSYMRLKWIDYVISYSAVEQRKVFTEVRSRGRKMRGWINGVFESIKNFFSSDAQGARDTVIKILLVGIPVAAGIISLFIYLRGRRKRRRGGRKMLKTRDVSVKFYRDFLTQLQKIGLRRNSSQTPSEFARIVCGSAPLIAGQTRVITARFLETRFGGRDFADMQNAELESELARLKSSIKTIKVARRRKKKSRHS